MRAATSTITCSCVTTAASVPRAPQALAWRPAAPKEARPLGRNAGGPRYGRQGAAAVGAAAARSPPGSTRQQSEDDTTGRDFASSLALMVLGAALVSERLNGVSLVEQLELDHPNIEPLLAAISAALAAAAAWPSKRKAGNATDFIRGLAGRLAFGGLSAAVAAEMLAGKGLLALMQIETGAQALSEVEAVLVAGLLLVLTVPPRKSSSA